MGEMSVKCNTIYYPFLTIVVIVKKKLIQIIGVEKLVQ